ncbi:BTB/POZ domain-containing protein 9-like [Adelges cooleyi]|uniref:BTB/POZ domain-containing protein 9-like n=1 Tax=Adelges cooleyi TaxID=133065 RepID=UPI00217F5210|nr:BTB/POZ domain-containing protein 9-like [Adelges cooleyi]
MTEQHSNKEINHTDFLVSDLRNLYLSDKFSDVVLIVDEERLQAHRAVLASRSEYFGSLLHGNYIESHNSEVNIKEASAFSFKILLEYIYTGRMSLDNLEDEVILELFTISDYFSFPNLQYSLSEHLRRNIRINNACSMFTVARLYQHKQLVFEILDFIITHALDVLQSKDFLSLSADALQEILIHDSFCADEIDIFRAVFRWIKENQYDPQSDAISKVLSTVRYPLMSNVDLFEVWNSQLVSFDTISAAMHLRDTGPPHILQFRGQLKPNVNLADRSQDFQIMSNVVGGAIIKLGHPSIINHIEMVFYDINLGDFSYIVENSMDGQHWWCVIDHSNYIFRSIQDLWIHPSVVVSYMRVRRTNSTVKTTIKYLEISYNTIKKNLVEIVNGFVVPKENVALLLKGAIVIDGFKNLNFYHLLSGGYYDGSEGYTWHWVGSGCILVQLAQPYVLSSIRMLLWDHDDRVYMYTVEASVNKNDWEIIVNKSKEPTRSWQVLQFEPRPIVYIRVTGVYSSVGYDFRCVYLEAPAQVPLDSNVVEAGREEDNLISETLAQSSVA